MGSDGRPAVPLRADHRRLLGARPCAGAHLRGPRHGAALFRPRCRATGGARRGGVREGGGGARGGARRAGRGGDGVLDRRCGPARPGDRECRRLGRHGRRPARVIGTDAAAGRNEPARRAEHRASRARGDAGAAAGRGRGARADRGDRLDRGLRRRARRARLLRDQGRRRCLDGRHGRGRRARRGGDDQRLPRLHPHAHDGRQPLPDARADGGRPRRWDHPARHRARPPARGVPVVARARGAAGRLAAAAAFHRAAGPAGGQGAAALGVSRASRARGSPRRRARPRPAA